MDWKTSQSENKMKQNEQKIKQTFGKSLNKTYQLRLAKPKVNYSYGAYNKFNKEEQWIRITEGCPHNCPYCYEPQKIKIFGIPEIVRNDVKIMDMNLLCKEEALDIIK